ncbi:hypothetical protein HYW82_02215 [Candidatus Peregrinibacteria bacterium]|nr:hypothetical protein [Candidatus Peregrinibacteria bacterium]
MAKEKNVDVVVNGHNVSLKIPEFYIGRSGKDEAEASAAPGFLARLFGGDVFGGLSKQEKLMEKYERWAPLVFCAPWALGRPVEIIDVPAGRDGVPSIAYNVDFRGSFSKRQLAEQTEFLDWLLQQFKGELLTDEPWARNVVMQPSQKGIDEKLRRNRGRKKRKGAKRGMGNLPE